MAKLLQTARTLGLIGICTPALIGCFPEDDLSDLKIETPSPVVSLPLLNTNLTIGDIITIEDGKGILTENEDHSYHILYRSQIKTEPVKNFFPDIPEQHHSESFSLDINSPAFSLKSPPQTFRGDMTFDLNGLTVYALESKEGFLDLTLTSDYQHNVEVQVTFPNIKSRTDGSPFVWNPNVINGWSNRVSTERRPLSDYSIELVNGTVSYELEVTIDGTGRPISEHEELTLEVRISEVEFAYLSGNFNGIALPTKPDTLDIPILASAIEGTVALNPTLKMDFKNSYGVRIASDFSDVAIEQKSGNIVKLRDEGDYTFFSGEYNFPSATHRHDSLVTSSQVINRATSNIGEAFAELPRGLMYNLGFTLNSAPEDTSFVTDQSLVEVDLSVELPLEGRFDIILQDSIPVNFRDMEDVESMRILVKTENTFPIDAHLQIHFLGEDGELITDENGRPFSLFGDEDKILVAAELVDSNTGKTQPEIVDLPLVANIDQENFRAVRDATHLVVRTNLESVSKDANQVKLYSFYTIRFGLATQIKTSFD